MNPETAFGTPKDLSQLDTISSTSKLEKIVDTNEFAELTPCGLSGCRQPHKLGFKVLLTDGKLGVIGKDCGKRIFGEEWTEQFKIFKYNTKNRNLEERREHFNTFGNVSLKLWPLRGHYSEADLKRKKLRECLPNLYSELLKSTSKNDGKLTVDRPALEPSTKGEIEVVYRLVGLAAFSNGTSRSLLEKAILELDRISKFLTNDGLKNRTLSKLFKDYEKSKYELRRAHELYHATRSAFTERNFNGIQKWLNEIGEIDKYSIKGTHIGRVESTRSKADMFDFTNALEDLPFPELLR